MSPTAGVNGNISPAVAQKISVGGTPLFTVTPAAGYAANMSGTCGGTLVGDVYHVSPVHTNCSVDATFVTNTLPVTPTVGPNGTITPPSRQAITQGAIAGFSIAPAPGYAPVFGGDCPSGFMSGDVYATGQITFACNLSVMFTQNVHTVTPLAGLNGTMNPITPQVIAAGNATSFVLTPASVHFHPIVTGTCGGSLLGNVYTTNPVNADCNVFANFPLNTYTVTPSASANGTISPNSAVTANDGSSAVFTVSPSPGYAAVMGGTCAGSLVGNTYYTNFVYADCTVTATFTNVAFTVTPSAGPNGSISPTSPQSIAQGAKASFTIIPDNGYKTTVAGTCGGSFSNQYIFNTNTINSDCTVSATFSPKTYTVTPSATANGSITPSTGVTVNHGSTTTFTITPDQGYTAAVGGTCGGTLSGNTYTTNAITAACTVAATFTQVTFIVTPSSGANGSISPSTPQIIAQGATTNFTVVPNAGYIASVGGTCGGSLSGNIYTTNAITSACSVAATFTQGTAIALLSVASRKFHGANTFDLNVATGVAITDSISVEPRIGFGTHTLVFHFDSPVTSAGTVTAVNANGIDIGTATTAISGNDILVTLSSIPNNRRVLVSLAGVNGLLNTSAAVGFLIGDVNGSHAIDSADVATIRATSGQAASATNFVRDLDRSGHITAADISAAKARVGMVLQ